MTVTQTRKPQHGYIAALGIGQIISWGTLFYSFPLIADSLGVALGLEKQGIYAAASIGLLVSSLSAFPVGAAIDRGYGRVVMVSGAVLGGALLMVLGRLESAFWLYPVFIGLGLAQAMTLYEPCFAVVARRFGPHARDGITALTLWGGFAATVFVPLTQMLIEQMGWRDALVVVGAISLLCCAVLYGLTIRPQSDHRAGPAYLSQGFEPPVPHRVAAVLRMPVFWALAASLVFYNLTFAGLTFHLYPLLLEQGYSVAISVGAVALIGPAQVAGRVAIWLFAARQPVRIIGAATALAFPVAILILLAPPNVALVGLFGVLYGIANGMMTIVRGLAVSEMVSPHAYGTLNGLIAGPANAAKAIAPLAMAWIWGVSQSYQPVLWAALLGASLMTLAFWAAGMMGRVR